VVEAVFRITEWHSRANASKFAPRIFVVYSTSPDPMPRLVFLNKGQIIANTLKSISSQSAQNYCNYFQQTGDFSTLLTRCVCPVRSRQCAINRNGVWLGEKQCGVGAGRKADGDNLQVERKRPQGETRAGKNVIQRRQPVYEQLPKLTHSKIRVF